MAARMSPISSCRECVLCLALPKAVLWKLDSPESHKLDESLRPFSEYSCDEHEELDFAEVHDVTQKVRWLYFVVFVKLAPFIIFILFFPISH
jgi:hypothetical protein